MADKELTTPPDAREAVAKAVAAEMAHAAYTPETIARAALSAMPPSDVFAGAASLASLHFRPIWEFPFRR